MVAHAELPEEFAMSLEKFTEAINATSGQDVVIHAVRQVAADFHARFSALDREYHYTIFRRRTALARDYSWYVRGDLDLNVMSNLASHLIGEHDFTSFSKRSDDLEHYRCSVDLCKIEEDGDRLIFIIRANRFVRGMVRAIIGGVVETGKGKLKEEQFIQLLHNPTEDDRAKYLAPAQGLVFWKVRYPKEFGLWE